MTEASQSERLPNGPGAAAVVAAGLGAVVLGVLAIVADHSAGVKREMIFYRPSGPLSGVSSLAVVVWLLSWIGLDVAWRRRQMPGWVVMAGLGLIAVGFVLMFPPVGDLF